MRANEANYPFWEYSLFPVESFLSVSFLVSLSFSHFLILPFSVSLPLSIYISVAYRFLSLPLSVSVSHSVCLTVCLYLLLSVFVCLFLPLCFSLETCNENNCCYVVMFLRA